MLLYQDCPETHQRCARDCGSLCFIETDRDLARLSAEFRAKVREIMRSKNSKALGSSPITGAGG